MIKVTLNEILNSIDIFRKLSEETLPIKAAYKIARLLRELDKETATFDESRKKIIEKYAEYENDKIKLSENGNIVIQKDKINLCNDELVELLSAIIEINAEPLNIEDLGNIEITPAQLINLSAFINE